MCLLLLFLYVFAIAMTQIAVDTPVGSQYFSTVPHSMKTLLLSGVFLDNFGLVCNNIKRDNALSLFAFFVFVLLGNLTVINMLIGVLCEVVSDVASREKEEMSADLIKEKMKLILGKLDENGDMQISKEEFYKIFKEREATFALQGIGIDPVSLVDLADFIFSDGIELSFEEFMAQVLRLRGSNCATAQDCLKLQNLVEMQLASVESNMTDSMNMAASASCKRKNKRMSTMRHACSMRRTTCCVDNNTNSEQAAEEVKEQQQLRCSIARQRERTSRLEVELRGVLGELQQLRNKAGTSSLQPPPAKSISCRLAPSHPIPHRRYPAVSTK